MSPDDDRIVLDSVSKRYGDLLALDDVSLRIGGGQYHCLVGPNGSGKSTILRLILGLTDATSGTVSIPPVAIGCGFQQPNFYPDLSVRENLDIFGRLAGADDPDWRKHVVETLRLERALHRRAGALSGGFARKLDLALALLAQPEILLLDEPLGALDDVSTVRFLDFLQEYNERGHTILFATHRITEFEADLDRITVMHRGEILFDGGLAAIDLDDHSSVQEYYVEAILTREGIDSR